MGDSIDLREASSFWMRVCSALVLGFVRGYGQRVAADIEQLAMRRHQRKHFLPGLEKLGLLDESNDVRRCAKYHFLSNVLGGLPLEYVEESPTKIWLRYRAPYWVGDGVVNPSAGPAALASVMGRAPFLGWHANNGAVLGNPHLVFVQTQNLLDGDPWDAGYYTETDETYEPGSAYRRRTGEWGPPADLASAPQLPNADWPDIRKQRALRNYAVSTTASRISAAESILGAADTAQVVERALATVLTQFWALLPGLVGLSEVRSMDQIAEYFIRVSAFAGDELIRVPGHGDGIVLRQESLRMWRHEDHAIPEVDSSFGAAWNKAIGLYDPAASLTWNREPDGGFEWNLTSSEEGRT